MDNVIQRCKALSDPNRIRIIQMLKIRPLCVCEITDVLQLAPSTVSKHLSILKEAGFVEDTKEGKWVNYSLKNSGINEFGEKILRLLNDELRQNRQITADREKIETVDRFELCET
ncbi:MAG: metalloregulator ArsR/SmtB family transcription factor [Candidatus Marinimicrobia bacterium]|nr:metalloregulator ArsR/SmtB family transcription factor [Candidatus Neomarinimicrobiota bacterium]